MKFKALILLIVLISSSYNFAQEFYIRLNSGYGIGLSNQTDYDYFSTENAPNVSNYSYKTKDYSYGKGTYFSGSLGYFFNQSIGFDLELQYLNGASYPIHREYNFINTGRSVYDYENSATAFMINPSVVLRTQLYMLKPYLKLGPAISFGKININTSGYNISTNNAKSTLQTELQYSGGVMLGLNAALGASYEVYKNIDLFIELSGKSISYAPKDGEIKKYIINGVDYLPQLPASSKKLNFVEVVESTDSQNLNNPSQQRKQYFPFSSLAFSMGISFTL